MNDRPVVTDILDCLEVEAPRARAAMQQYYRRSFSGARHPVRDAPATDRKPPPRGRCGTNLSGVIKRWHGGGFGFFSAQAARSTVETKSAGTTRIA